MLLAFCAIWHSTSKNRASTSKPTSAKPLESVLRRQLPKLWGGANEKSVSSYFQNHNNNHWYDLVCLARLSYRRLDHHWRCHPYLAISELAGYSRLAPTCTSRRHYLVDWTDDLRWGFGNGPIGDR